MPRDWTFTAMVVGAAVLLVIDLILLVRIARRLHIAFRERLDRLPGASLWRRARRGARFWSAIVVHLAIAAFLTVFAVVAGRFLLRVVFSVV